VWLDSLSRLVSGSGSDTRSGSGSSPAPAKQRKKLMPSSAISSGQAAQEAPAKQREKVRHDTMHLHDGHASASGRRILLIKLSKGVQIHHQKGPRHSVEGWGVERLEEEGGSGGTLSLFKRKPACGLKTSFPPPAQVVKATEKAEEATDKAETMVDEATAETEDMSGGKKEGGGRQGRDGDMAATVDGKADRRTAPVVGPGGSGG
jgi:hypothetical protein